MPAPEVLQSLADAIGGLDREAAYRKGMAERADIDQTQAQTEAALQLARDRRLDAQRKEREAAAAEALREQLANLQGHDQTGFDPYNVMVSGLGDEYAGLQQGRLRAQEYNLTERIATPSMGFGDEVYDPEAALDQEYAREAALEARAPGPAVTARHMMPNPEIGIDPETGRAIFITRQEAIDRRLSPGSRPSAAGGAAQNAGGLSSAVSGLIYRQASALFGGTYDPLSGRFAGLDRESMEKVQRLASRASVIFKAGGVDPQTAVDQALSEAQAAAESGTEIPPQFGDAIQQDDVDPSTGQPWEAVDAQGNRVRWINGQWTPAQ